MATGANWCPTGDLNSEPRRSERRASTSWASRTWCSQGESNTRHRTYQVRGLPLAYESEFPGGSTLSGAVGISPRGLARSPSARSRLRGLEPATSTLQKWRSSAELNRRCPLCWRGESNTGHPTYEIGGLPLTYASTKDNETYSRGVTSRFPARIGRRTSLAGPARRHPSSLAGS